MNTKIVQNFQIYEQSSSYANYFTVTTSPLLGGKYFHATINIDKEDLAFDTVNLELMFGRQTSRIKIKNNGPQELKPPKFNQNQKSSRIKIEENNVIGSIVHQMEATATSGRLYYSLDSRSEIFAINPNSGEIMLTSKLDFRTQPEHKIGVIAVDRTLQYIDKIDTKDKNKGGSFRQQHHFGNPKEISVTDWVSTLPKMSFARQDLTFLVQPTQKQPIFSFQNYEIDLRSPSKHAHFGILTIENFNSEEQRKSVFIKRQTIDDFAHLSILEKNQRYDIWLDLDLLKTVMENSVEMRKLDNLVITIGLYYKSQLLEHSINVQVSDVLPKSSPRLISPPEIINVPAFTPAKTVIHQFQAISYDFSSHFLEFRLNTRTSKFKLDKDSGNLIALDDYFGNERSMPDSLEVELVDTRYPAQKPKSNSIRLSYPNSEKINTNWPKFQNCEKIRQKLCKLNSDSVKVTEKVETDVVLGGSLVLGRVKLKSSSNCAIVRACDFGLPYRQCSFAMFGDNCNEYSFNKYFRPKVTCKLPEINSNKINLIEGISDQKDDILRYVCENCAGNLASIDQRTGLITSQKSFSAEITVRSMLYHTKTTCRVNVKSNQISTKTTDTPPKWSSEFNYGVFMPLVEKISAKGPITTVTAIDAEGMEVTYSLLKTAGSENFRISETTGRLVALNCVDGLLQIVASDGSTSSAVLNIEVNCVKQDDGFGRQIWNSQPKFRKDKYVFRICEDLPPYSIIGVLDTTLEDTIKNAQLRFSLDPESFLQVDPKSGILKLVRQLDFETRKIHKFTGRVRYQRNLQTPPGTTKIILIITDETEFGFKKPILPNYIETSVNEIHPVGHKIRDFDLSREVKIIVNDVNDHTPIFEIFLAVSFNPYFN